MVSEALLLDHEGPWSEADYLALPEGRRRIELLDGGLLVNPSLGSPHQWMSSQFWLAMARAVPDGLQVLEAVNVRVAPGKILIPDLVVVSKPGADIAVWDPVDVVMAIEIVSRGSVATDRAVKPQLYAAAGIRYYLRIELCSPGPSAWQYRLVGDRYREIVHAEPLQRLRLTEPFALDLDLAALAASTRPE
ncbi:MAG: Uma2 family endonuclease [Pseudonocardiales bacterium]